VRAPISLGKALPEQARASLTNHSESPAHRLLSAFNWEDLVPLSFALVGCSLRLTRGHLEEDPHGARLARCTDRGRMSRLLAEIDNLPPALFGEAPKGHPRP